MAAPNADVFDSYFRRADLDKDGRISGAEAVAFFQGSNLPKHVLAQIWMHADQNRIGFLGRAEFYNMLKLVTVAQSGRELTPEIVKAALYGPAAAKIPPPQINSAAMPAPQLNPVAPQNPGVRVPQGPPSVSISQQFSPSPSSQFARPPQPTSTVQGFPRPSSMMGPLPPTSNSPNLSTDWFGGRPSGPSTVATSQVAGRAVSPSMTLDRSVGSTPSVPTSSMQPRPPASSGLTPSTLDGFGGLASSGFASSTPRQQTPSVPTPSFATKSQDSVLQLQPKDSKASTLSGNGFSSDSIFGGDVFSAAPQPKEVGAALNLTASSAPASTAIVPVVNDTQSSVKQSQVDPFHSSAMTTSTSQLQRPPLPIKPNQSGAAQGMSVGSTPGVSVGAAGSAAVQSQHPWPKMSQSDIQKYAKVFVEVDTDRDGKITGEQARNLFLSWRLPREVLKQVWDLSDQDNDSMLSLREFCTALYLMERYREGHTLPPVLPDSVRFDETLLRATGQPTTGYGWQPPSGLPQQGFSGARLGPATGSRPPTPASFLPQTDGTPYSMLQKSRLSVMDKHHPNHLSKDGHGALNSKFPETSDADKKAEDLQKDILDSREKIEYYRTKMQELVLYKSRCDNRLNEITERASADKREVETLAKKYEEKYKQVGEIASKLTIEEATFRELQERKMELFNAITKVEQGGSADGLLQVRVDRIHSDLEGLAKVLKERCKKHALNFKQTVFIELPFGWQPGVQEGAADWDEDWDKFEDEGFVTSKDVAVNDETKVAPSRPAHVWNDITSTDEASGEVSPTNVDSKIEKPSSIGGIADGSSIYAESEADLTRSPPGSPHRRSSLESPSQEFSTSPFVKNMGADASPHTKESQSDHGGAESTVSRDKFDERSWGATFDVSDTDSVWGFNPIKTKEFDHDQHRQSSFFDSGELGLHSTRIDSPNADSIFQKKEKSPFFADSVPGTPLFNSNSSPGFSEDNSFDNLARFDSFSMNDGGIFNSRDSFARFDSMRNTRDSDRSRGFPSFDDSDPFGSTGPFKSSGNHQTSKPGSDSWSAF